MAINAIRKIAENKYLLTHDDGDQYSIYETFLSQPIEEIKKYTYDLKIYREALIIKAFLDGGASITCCGKAIAQLLSKYLDNSIRSSITAGGMDANETGKFYKSTIKYKVPVELKEFNMDKGKTTTRKVYVRVWYLPCLEDDLLIIGRDTSKELGIGVFAHHDLKKCIYYHIRNRLWNKIPSDDEISAYLEKLEYRNGGDPGIYRISPSNQVTKVPIRFAKKSHCTDLDQAHSINTVSLYELTDNINYIRKTETCPKQRIFRLENGDYAKYGEEGNTCIKIIDDDNIEEAEENGLKLRQNVSLSTSTILTEDKLDGKTVSYPQILDQINYSPLFTKREILNHKLRLAPYAKVFAEHDFDVGKVTSHPPLKILIKDEYECKILQPYDLNPADQEILRLEAKNWTDNGLMEWQSQENEDHVLVHASPAFVVHQELGKDERGNIMVKSRVVKDLRHLNANTYEYIYDNMTIDELHTRLAGSKIINTTDIKKWFYHIPLAKESRKYAGVRIKGGALISNRALQGMKNAPIHANETSHRIFGEVADCIQDDLNKGFKNEDMAECKRLALDNMVDICIISYENTVKLNVKKTYIGFPKLASVGRMVSADGISLLKRHSTNALETKYEHLKNKSDLLVFIGMVQQMNEYIPDVAMDIALLKEEILKPACLPPETEDGIKLTIKEKNMRTILVRSEEGRMVFDRLQARIRNALILHHPDMKITSKHRFLLKVDTSLYQTGASLWQQKLHQPPFTLSEDPNIQDMQIKQKYNLIKLYSRSLAPAQQRYSATEREALGLFLAIKKFHRYLIIKPFDVLGDHKPLVAIFSMNQNTSNSKFPQLHLTIYLLP